MKVFSINYTLGDEDYKYLNSSVNKAMFLQRVKLTSFVLFVTFVFTLMNLFSLGVTASFLLLIMFFAGDIVNRTYLMRVNKNSKTALREMKLDFYKDHIEFFLLPNESFKGLVEKHYPLNSVEIVMENEKHIYLSFEDNQRIIIPKEKIDSESYSKIKNMINNLYPDKFLEE